MQTGSGLINEKRLEWSGWVWSLVTIETGTCTDPTRLRLPSITENIVNRTCDHTVSHTHARTRYMASEQRQIILGARKKEKKSADLHRKLQEETAT